MDDSVTGWRFDPGALVTLLLRRWKLLALVSLPILAAVILITFAIKPTYYSAAQIKLDPSQHSPVDLQAIATGAPPDQAMVDTEVSLMRSRGSVQAVVAAYRLDQDPEFGGRPGGAGPIGRERAIGAVLAHLDVRREGSTYVVDVGFHSRDPAKAAMLANAFATQYFVNSRRALTGTAAQRTVELKQRLQDAGARVRVADQQLADYRARTGLTTSGQSGTITEQQIGDLSGQLATAQSDAASARANLASAQQKVASGGLAAVPNVSNSPLIAQLREKRADLIKERAEMADRYGPKYVEYQVVEQQLADLDKQIADEGRQIVSSLQSTSQSADARAASLRGELARLRGEQSANTRATAVADNLQRQAEVNSNIYTQVAQAAQQTEQQQNSADVPARIVQPASIPSAPASPNRPLLLLLGGLLAGMSSLAAITLAEAMVSTVRTIEDVEQRLGLPLLASVPRLTARQLRRHGGAEEAPWNYVVARPLSAFAESLRTIRGGLSIGGGVSKVVVITSAMPGEGKTTTAIALARLCAISGDRTVLIDCDLRRRSASIQLAEADAPGLIDLLEGRAALDEVLIQDEVNGMAVIPVSGGETALRDVLSGPSFADLLARLRQAFDAVIVDTAPLLLVQDARTVAAHGDATLLVLGWNKVRRSAARAARARLDGAAATPPQAVLAMVERQIGIDAAYPGYGGAMTNYYQN